MKIVVVGAGISGLSAAWALAKRGYDVTLCEQGPIPNLLAASGDHHRIIRRAYGPSSGYGRAISEAFDAWEELWADLEAVHYDPRGFACISRAPGDEAQDYRDGLAAGGYAFDEFGAVEAARRWPFLDPETIRFGILSGDGGALHCRRIAVGILEWLRGRKNADVRENTLVESIDADAGTVRLASGEELAADHVVVTAGAWVTRLFPDLTSDLTTFRTAVVYLDPPDDLKPAWDTAPVFLDVGGTTDGYIIPPTGGAGLKFGSGLHKVRNADADANRVPLDGEGEIVRDLFSPPFARLDEYRVTSVATCAYTFTRDERFFGQARGKALIVSACSGHGYKFGAAIGRRVADAVETCDFARLQRWLLGESV